MTENYAYPWNAPREAIASPYPTYDEIHHRNHLNAQKAEQIAKLVQAHHLLEKQPQIVQFDIKRRMAELEKSQGEIRANAYLTKTFVERTLPRVECVNIKYRLSEMKAGTQTLLTNNSDKANGAARASGALWELMRRFNRLPDMARADVDLLAGDIANFALAELVQAHAQSDNESDYKYAHRIYMTAATITREFNQTPPLWEKVTSRLFDPEEVTPAIMRMQTEKWWKGRLRRIAASWREHLQIALANVSKKHTPYASNMTVSEWREQKRRTREFLKGLELENEETGERISLIDKFDSSVSNPAIKRCELMNRIRGFENICNEMGFVGEFYTVTAPSRYHATIKTGHRNRKWNGTSPADTQRYLCNVWQKIRAKLHREEIRIFGIRVAEPHHDATPHWHMLMFMLPENVDRVREVISDYAWREDGSELTTEKARRARFHAETIDPDKGSATGYVAKYISKNIDGYALDGELDDESGKELKETASAVSAWAARWHIRQFQFIGGAPVTVYRELRRMADSETAHGLSIEFAAAHDAADAGDWAGYVNAQGGAFVRRDELAVRTWYQPSEDLNAYGEETIRIKGVYAKDAGADTPILTRLAQWKIVPKRAVDLAVDVKGASAPSWSSVNNCTAPPDDDSPIDFTRSPTRAERRRILKRLHESTPAKPRKKRQAPVSDKYRDQRKQLKDSFYDVSRLTLSEGEVTRMMMGHKLKVGAQIFWSGTSGYLFVEHRKPSTALQRFKALAARHRKSSNVQ
ncbi:replication endonuclease [Candidatus Pantoea floridensis]|uniref:Bacteriophage replication gene A protein (GPA) n=1 Tax=Candidatus Pantoea floridensis TaxID=1938870 RepID=A0A286BYQ1_9GAMM|nr:replication endonuclease [Pantoea floridensis]PIF21772.1 bacteriophage replication gene A protein [Enterobacteriaceae bacterium JKS000233]SOD39282.1 Bacteriophage replication gene A protein (GPA) [Pantoea floridensis]